MQRILKFSAICLAAGALGACDKPALTIATENIPTAGVRFINAVPDSSGVFGLDFRFVDIVESNAHFRIPFRSGVTVTSGVTALANVQYKGARVTGTPRQYVIFMDDTLASRASVALATGTLTIEKDHNYTVIIWGAGRGTGADAMKVTVIDETAELAKAPINGDPGAAKVGLRVINATNAAISASYYPCTGTTAACVGTVPGTAQWPTIAAFSASTFALADTAFYKFNVTGAGVNPTPFADIVALPGTPALCSNLTCVGTQKPDQEAFPGTKQGGSAVTLVVFPGSTPSTTAAPVFAAANVFTTGNLTGTSSIAGTATGYARTTGSFVSDGFVVGQTVTADGFTVAANNGNSVITAVTALAMTVTKTGGTAVDAVSAATTARSIKAPRPSAGTIWDRRPARCTGC